jgi:ABC-type branched-subunit amino acid transport system substrate-binding protein
MDLLIGPIYKSAAKMAARFANENNVTVINPLSQDADVAANSKNVLLFESSVATQARQAATYAYNNFSPKQPLFCLKKHRQILHLRGITESSLLSWAEK